LSRLYTWYNIKKLVKWRLTRSEKRNNVVFYELTEESKRLLALCEGTVFPAMLYRFDKCQAAYEILADGMVPENFRKVEKPSSPKSLSNSCTSPFRLLINWFIWVRRVKGFLVGCLFLRFLNWSFPMSLRCDNR